MGRSLKIALFCCAALIMFAIVHSASHPSNTATAPQATPGPWSSVPQAPAAQSPAAQPPAVIVNNNNAEQTHYTWPDLSAPAPANTAQTPQAENPSGSSDSQGTSASGSLAGSSDASASIEPSVSTSSTGEPSSPDTAQTAPETASQRVARRLRGH
jgi:hypothetical protein